MGKVNSEILFNKRIKASVREQTPKQAKEIIYLLQEHIAECKNEGTVELANLYNKKISKSVNLINRKIEEDSLRPFEFLLNKN